MSKHFHEIRDPIHVFVRLDTDEREVLDSRPFQRLRHIHQLALTYLLYPAATHKRFEHSLGVMELAGRVFDVVTHAANVTDEIRELCQKFLSRTSFSIGDGFCAWLPFVTTRGTCRSLMRPKRNSSPMAGTTNGLRER